jgi:primosomal protein N' (replication factor Y)
MDHSDESDVDRSRLRRVETVLDDKPLLSGDALWLIRFTSDYYHHPIGEVAAAALPALLRRGKALHPVLEFVAVTDAGEHADIAALTKRAPRQADLLVQLIDARGNGIDTESLTDMLPNWRRAAKALFEKTLITRFEGRRDEHEAVTSVSPQPGPTLDRQQEEAIRS